MFEGKTLNEARSNTFTQRGSAHSLRFFQPSYDSTGPEYDHASVRVRSLDTKGLETRSLLDQVVYRLPCIL